MRSTLGLFLALAIGQIPLVAQTPNVPRPVLRRLAQAIWPDQLFDTTGAPEGPWTSRPFAPKYSDLRIQPPETLPPPLAGIRVYGASAYPSGCWHCATVYRAVVEHDGTFVTLMDADDLGLVLNWASPSLQPQDSIRIRDALLRLAQVTGLLGPDVHLVRSRSDLPQRLEGWWRAAGSSDTAWTFPRPNSHVSTAGLTLKFAIRAGTVLYSVYEQVDHRGAHHTVFRAVADATLNP